MAIRLHLDGEKFDPETIRVMGLAFEMALVALRLADRGDLANDVLARKIMDLAKAGERDPERLCEGVLHEFRAPPPQSAFPTARIPTCASTRSDAMAPTSRSAGSCQS